MAKERRCRKCKLTYQGLRSKCPYCHKSTHFGIFNKIMCVFGYISFFITIAFSVYYLLIMSVVNAIWFMPTIATIIIIAIIIGIIIYIFK